ncbi:MAG: hypothetical protein KDJ44_02890 [Rhodoblastus sp.]|nr:hypothetical protein [Rhodoblastus sp.]MCC0004713.1 hypothetical protein [Methylobacteriaceae bacterium]
MPTLFIFAGPNGAGKTSLAHDTLPDSIPLISPDDIAVEHKLSPAAAAREAINTRHTHLKNGASFAIDTTFSGVRPYDILNLASAHGFSTHVVAVLLDSLDVARNRVAHRVALGGHAVPSADIERRFGRCIENLRSMPPLFTELSLFDNSDAAPRHFLTVTPTHATIIEPPPQHIIEATPDFARTAVEKSLSLPHFPRATTIPVSPKADPRRPTALQSLEQEVIERNAPTARTSNSDAPNKPKGSGIGD